MKFKMTMLELGKKETLEKMVKLGIFGISVCQDTSGEQLRLQSIHSKTLSVSLKVNQLEVQLNLHPGKELTLFLM